MRVLHKKVGFDVRSKVSETKRSKGKVEEKDYRERGMYSSITIDGFRRFDHLELNDLSRINLLLGDNNSGKTSVLEAIFTHACGLNFGSFQRTILPSRRSSITGHLDFGERTLGLFKYKSNLPYTFKITVKVFDDPASHILISKFEPSTELSELDPRMLGKPDDLERIFEDRIIDFNLEESAPPVGQISVQTKFLGIWQTQLDGIIEKYDLTFLPSNTIKKKPFKMGIFQDILNHRKNTETQIFGYLKRYTAYNLLDKFTNELKKVFPEIQKIDMIPYPDGTTGPVVITTETNETLPIYLFGDGLRRWYHLLGDMIVYKNSVHLIDEVDVSFHPGAQKEFSKLLFEYAKEFDNQLFLTSHSIEFADNFLEVLYGENGVVAKDDEDPVRVITLRLTEDRKDVEVWRFTGREAYESRLSYNLELR
jgi:AAA15 family ATPase/GTPase